MKKISLILFVQIAYFKCLASGGTEVGAQYPPAAPHTKLERYCTEDLKAGHFRENLRTFVSVVTISRDAVDADRGGCKGCSDYNGTALAFKACLEKDRNSSNVLWYMFIRFLPRDKQYYRAYMGTLESKVEGKILLNPDTYGKIYGTNFGSQILREEIKNRQKVFFHLEETLSPEAASLFERRKIFEWPVPAVAQGTVGHTTPQDIIDTIYTLKTFTNGRLPKFPLYTLRGISYWSDAINCCGFCTRALEAFGLPIKKSLTLKVYLNHTYAADYKWYKLGRLAFAARGPKMLTPELFIEAMRELFVAHSGYGYQEGDQNSLKTFFPDAFRR